jgi:hypothetical protein
MVTSGSFTNARAGAIYSAVRIVLEHPRKHALPPRPRYAAESARLAELMQPRREHCLWHFNPLKNTDI